MKKIFLISLLFIISSCGRISSSELDIAETAQQVGDVMASIDESGGSTGEIAFLDRSIKNTFARYAPDEDTSKLSILQLIEPKAQASACSTFGGFNTCSSNVITRTFAGCTVGSAVFNGTVQLTWGGSSTSCTLSGAGDTITRVPNLLLQAADLRH